MRPSSQPCAGTRGSQGLPRRRRSWPWQAWLLSSGTLEELYECSRVCGTEECRTSHKFICPRGTKSRRIRRIYSPVNSDVKERSSPIRGQTERPHLCHRPREKRLAPKTGLHRHQEHRVDTIQERNNRLYLRSGVDSDPSADAGPFQELKRPEWEPRRLHVKEQLSDTGSDERVERVLRVFDHQVGTTWKG